MSERYVAVVGGDEYFYRDLDEAMGECMSKANEQFHTMLRYRSCGPLTEEEIRRIDVSLYRTAEKIPLPIQDWWQQHHQELRDEALRKERREFARYIELRDKYEERYLLGDRPDGDTHEE